MVEKKMQRADGQPEALGRRVGGGGGVREKTE